MNQDVPAPPEREVLQRAAPPYALILATLLAAAAAIAATLRLPHHIKGVSADSIYLLSLYRDLFERAGSLADWRLTPAPYIVPDALILFPILAAGARPGTAFVLFSAILLIAGLVAALATGRLVLGARAPATLIVWAGAIGAAAWSEARGLDLLSFLVANAFHGAAIPVGLACVALAWRSRRARRALRAYQVIAALMVLNDLLFVPQFLIPITAALAWEARSAGRRPLLKRTLQYALAPAAAGLAARATLQLAGLVGVGGGINVHHAPGRWTSASYAAQIGDALAQIAALGAPSLALSAAGLAAALVLARSARGEERFFGRFVLVCGLCTLLFPLVTTNLHNAQGARYWSALFFVVPLAMVGLRAPLARGARNAACALAALAALTVAATSPRPPDLEMTPRPFVACVDAIAAREGLSYGIGGYWVAKPLQELGRSGAHVAAFELPRLEPKHWISSRAWGRRGLGEHNFVVTPGGEGGPETERVLRERFGPPRARFACEGHAVLIYDGPEHAALREAIRGALLGP